METAPNKVARMRVALEEARELLADSLRHVKPLTIQESGYRRDVERWLERNKV